MPPNKENQTQLLDACVEFVSKQGLKGVSLRSLALGVNMSARMLMHYFGNSENLFGSIMREFVEREKDRADELCHEARQAKDPLTDFIRRYCLALTTSHQRSLANNIFEMYGTAILGSTLASQLLEELLLHWVSKVVEVAPSLDASQARMVIAFANGTVFDLLATEDKDPVFKSIDAFVKQLGTLECSDMPLENRNSIQTGSVIV